MSVVSTGLALDGSALGVSELDVLTLDVSAPALDVSTLDVSALALDVSALDVSRLDVSALDVSESDVSMMYQCWVCPGWMYPQTHRDQMYHSLSNLKQRCITFHAWCSVGIHWYYGSLCLSPPWVFVPHGVSPILPLIQLHVIDL